MAQPSDGSTTASRGHILVVDDERHIVRMIQANLVRLGYTVTCAYDGNEAIELLQRERFDRAILDLVMPTVNGNEVLEWIRTHDETKDMWVAIVTTSLEEGAREKTAPHHADLYVTKPFNPSDLQL